MHRAAFGIFIFCVDPGMAEEDIIHGGSYYATLIATNGAGLSVSTYSKAMMVDDTAPRVHVYICSLLVVVCRPYCNALSCVTLKLA